MYKGKSEVEIMIRTVLKSKIHRARITEAKLHYEGSITIDEDLMSQADLIPGEKVEVFSFKSGARLETYVIKGEAGSGVVCMNGPAAHSIKVGDEVVIVAYALAEDRQAKAIKPKIVKVDERNRIKD
ncbi:aspartate 1-decarboxylase [Candidatus Omnitrophota bacterium]